MVERLAGARECVSEDPRNAVISRHHPYQFSDLLLGPSSLDTFRTHALYPNPDPPSLLPVFGALPHLGQSA